VTKNRTPRTAEEIEQMVRDFHGGDLPRERASERLWAFAMGMAALGSSLAASDAPTKGSR